MKRVLLVLPFVLAACATDMTAPSESFVRAGNSMSAKGEAPTCTISGIEYARGVNENGYNYCARIFSGTADGVDKLLDGLVWGDPAYANDHLTMKWNAAWDECNAVGTPETCAGAWTDNEWNGKVPGGSGEVWHYKIVWSAVCATGGALTDGGYCVWNSYEVLMDHGKDPNGGPGQIWFARAKPNGYGN